AVPLLALRLPVDVAAPLAVLVSITVAAIVLVQDHRDVHLRSAGWLVGATLLGIPLGLLLLVRVDGRVVKAVLGVVIVGFALFSFRARPAVRQREGRDLPWLFGCGFLAGVLGGAYGMNGPPLVVYGALRGWSPARFRATLQAYFLPASAIGMVGYVLAGVLGPEVVRDYLWSLPATVVATLLGRVASRRLGGDTFRRVVYASLVVTGAALLAQAAWGA
ncbi:MAG TPA: sulfite exporter TauE/SafE family protein, partial [Minicystis sp.]|nr:sulfite exporter TauE/SafE family protein [Minicystis sp.]